MKSNHPDIDHLQYFQPIFQCRSDILDESKKKEEGSFEKMRKGFKVNQFNAAQYLPAKDQSHLRVTRIQLIISNMKWTSSTFGKFVILVKR